MEMDHVFSQLFNYLPEIWDSLPSYDCGELNQGENSNPKDEKVNGENGTLKEVDPKSGQKLCSFRDWLRTEGKKLAQE